VHKIITIKHHVEFSKDVPIKSHLNNKCISSRTYAYKKNTNYGKHFTTWILKCLPRRRSVKIPCTYFMLGPQKYLSKRTKLNLKTFKRPIPKR